MDRQRALTRLANKLRAALAADDWQALAAINVSMATALPAMAGQAPWSPAEQAALATLQQLHQQATARCDAAVAEMSKRLHAMQTNKEGWIAYALSDDSTDPGTPA
ncbi:MAG TPA: hypothetical protein VJ752_19085 [Burkholderiaceae bacterium]|nr:hypothetical protein [Burkholderiaceae bacterium]